MSRPSTLLIRLATAALVLAATAALGAPAKPASPQPPAGAAAKTAAPAAPVTTAPAPLAGVVGNSNTGSIADVIPGEQQLTLEAGKNDSFAGRYVADLDAVHRGAVLILHDTGQNQDWPYTVAALLDDLPLHGWNTLAIKLPSPAPAEPAAVTAAPPPAAPAAAAPPTSQVPPQGPPPAPAKPQQPAGPAPGGSAKAAETKPDIEARAQARIDAAISRLAALNGGQPQPVVVIGFGSGAWRAADYARHQAAGSVTALVLVDADNQLPKADDTLPAMLPATALPTLDIVQGSDPLALAAAEARRRAVLRQPRRIYDRLDLPPAVDLSPTAHSLLVHRIRGWIQHFGAGAPPPRD